MKKHFTISVVILIHRTERYLEDTIRSILYQTLDFEQKIQLILVSDCSGGVCEELYKKYEVMYPENIMYLCLDACRNKNARKNAGMKYAAGKYINFMDAGSMWSLNAFEKAVCFFENYGQDIELIAADTQTIEAVNEKIPFNQRLTAHKIIDINKQYSSILYRASSCIMRTETVRRYSFNEQIEYWGGLLLINQTVLYRQKFGMFSSEVMHYCHAGHRETVLLELDYQRDLKILFDGIYQESMKRSGCILSMVQYFMACVLGEIFQQTIELSEAEREERCHDVFDKILQHIEDRYLLEAENVDCFVQKALVSYKYGVDIRDEINQMRMKEKQHQELYQYFDKTYKNYGVLKEWLLLHIKEKRISDYFDRNNYHKIAVYGMAELGQFFVMELENSGLDVKYGIDRRAEMIAAEIPVLTLEDDLPPVDVVIVTAVYYFNQIADCLKDKLECPVISIEDILYSIP